MELRLLLLLIWLTLVTHVSGVWYISPAQLPVTEIVGTRGSWGTATAVYSNSSGSSSLPSSVTNIAIDKATGVIYLAITSGGTASTVVAATPTGTGTYTLDTIAGNYLGSTSTDGVGTAATFKKLQGLAVDGCALRSSAVMLTPDASSSAQER